jgi:apolipoprotein N-acyltransferase
MSSSGGAAPGGGRTGRISWIAAAVVATAFLRFALFPPLSLAEAAYVFLVPVLWVDWARRSRRSAFAWGWLCGFLAWLPSLVWLRHVTVVGTLLLAAILALFFAVWLAACGRPVSRGDGRWIAPAAAALWVLLEWTRSWLFWGFPWNPVSVSQWNRPAVLSLVSVTGGWGLSFLLVWINVALARWSRQPFTAWRRKGFLPFLRAVPLSLVVPIGVLLASAIWYFPSSLRRVPSEPVRVGFVQPYASMKWDADTVSENLRVLWAETRRAAGSDPAILLWPESATPLPVVGNREMRNAIEDLAAGIGVPILMGNMAYYPAEGVYENGVFLVDPGEGLRPDHYAKRELVPFGEFVPFRERLPFLEKVVPIGLDCRPGTEAVVFPFPGDTWVGPLVCYEDVFPSLARATVREGADWLFVATNNAWYGEEAGAYQHAAHSVLRAVETRRPVLRSGNGGWSGWIDAWGHVRAEVTDAEGSIYFRGGEVVPVDRDLRFDGYRTPYVQWGDWFVAACGLLAIPLLRRG